MIAEDLRQFIESTLLALAALLPIVNPLGAAPVYLAKTVDLTPAEHADLSRRVAINCFLLLLASLLIGAYVLDFFDLSVPVVQVAGGLVVCSLAWSLLNQPDEPIEWVHEAAKPLTRPDLRTRAFYPLTMPLTVGPGSISVAITIGANQSQSVRSLIVNSAAHAVGHLHRRALACSSCCATPTRSCAGSARPAPPYCCVCPRSSCCASACRSRGTARRRCSGRSRSSESAQRRTGRDGSAIIRALRAGVAQLVEQRIRNAKVEGSTPSTGTIKSTVLD